MLTAKELITFILKEIEGNDTKSVDLTEVNETQIEELLNTLQQPEYENFTTTINLPEPFKNHRLQIQLDNLISNRQLNKNSQATTASLHSQPLSKPMIEKRVLPSGHIAPKIEITLYEAEETEASIANIETAAIDEIPNSDVVKPLERAGIAESMLMKILNQPLYQQKKTEWEQITHREQAKLFRQNPRESLGITNCKDHPLNILLESELKLKEMLQFWVTTLDLDLAQYDALLDVLGRHGPSGLERLFHSWSELSAHNAIAFKDMYHALLKKMPTYAPFIENPEFQDTLENIALLGKEKYSWWHALIRNHTQTSNFNDLPTLYRTFIKTTKSMEDMGLNFAVIDEINYKNDLPTTLTHMISLLNRCAPQDRPRQFSCIHEVSTLDNPEKLYFIVPEMNNKPYIEVTIEDLKTKKDTELLKKTVYCYLATQPCHLPLTTYANYLDAILNNSETSDEFKCKMAYILAKTTSSTDKTGFEIQEIAVEWQNFQTRIESLEALERMKANRGFFEKAAFETGLRAQGTDGPRLAAIQPIINMNPIPPISFLNKLLKSSEYKFLDPSLSLIALQGVQNEMMKTIEAAAAVYTLFPENMMHAIHFIKTETVTPDQNGQYFPDPKDVPLLEQFVNAAQRLTDKKNNTAENPERMPQNILLPILTVFHLEYLSSEELTTCINTYLNHINNHQSPDHQSKIQILLPYALSLFRWIKDRELPTPLNQNILNQIQNDLIKKITQNELSTKKDVRLWINQHYSDYFEQNKLLDIKDEINIDQELNEHNVVDPYARLAISSIVSNFNELEEEKDQLKGLTEQLIEFEKTLSRAETTRFYTYCNHALKTDKPLSRNRQTPPPSYLLEFQSLIHTLTSLKSIETFQQFMEISEDRVLQASSDGKNNLAKCNYLLTTLYPDLLTQGIPAREAFQFASEIVCSSPKEVLIKPILDLKLASSEQAKKQQISELRAKIKHLHQKIQPLQGFIELHELNELKKDLETMVTSFPPHADLFQEYKQVIDTIENLQTENENFYKKSFFGKLRQVIFEENKTWETRLKEAGLFSLTETDGPLIRDLTEAMNRQGVSFQDLTIDTHRKKIEFLNKYPSLTSRANNFINQALRIAPETPYKNYSSFVALIDQLIALDDQNIVLSLMYHYQGAADDRDVKNLAGLLSSIEFQALLKPTQKQVLHALVTQLNNGVDCTRQDIEAFVTFIHNNQNNPIVLQYLDKYYQHAPFPSLSTFMHWMQPPCEEEELKKIYADFDKNPCTLNDHNGREPENGFKRNKALTQLKLIPEIHAIFTEKYLNQIETTAEEAKQRSTEELLKEVKQFKNTQPKNHIKLAMYTIELMHRFKGRKPQFVGEKPIPGRSYELNTTQIISILAMLETGHKVTAQIGTGEGKSRIMMILNACQFLKGNTVDFITSDLALAERDYLEALPFYDSLGAKVSFITATSKIEDYQMDGINVSDPTNRCQFRSKAFSQKKSELVLNPDPKKRALHLDEADVTYYDVSNKQYNHALETPQQNIAILPLYSILMDFFAEEETERLYREDKIKCNKSLLARIKVQNPKLFEIIKNLPTSQLEKWQDAAYIARHLKYNVDYTIITDAKMPRRFGHIKVASAMCLIGSRIHVNAQLADDVHQCLHAELNRLVKDPNQEPQTANLRLQQALKSCQKLNRSFPITPKRKIMYTSSSDVMLKDYSDGYLFAVTGTLGIDLEKLEANTNFGTKFLNIPKHMGLSRVDKPTLITENEDRQLETLVDHILTSRNKNQPILMFCKDDNQSEEFYDKLQERLQPYIKNQLPKLTRISAENYRDGNTSVAQFLKNEGGCPGQVIITTEILGRGIEYELKGNASKAGLKVLLTYLPKGQRDYGQMIGRGGRYGQIGESQMVLNLRDLQQDFGINYRNRDFYVNPESHINRVQCFATYTKLLHRLFNKSFDDLLTQYTEQYNILSIQEENMDSQWSEFLEQYNQSKDVCLKKIINELEQKSPNTNTIESLLEDHQNHIAGHWQQLLKSEQTEIFTIKKPNLLRTWLHTLKDLQRRDKHSTVITETRNVKTQAHYEAANAGRMAVFDTVENFKRWRDNFLAWRRGEGLLFPNFYAWRTGQLSTWNYLSQFILFNIFIKPKDETQKIKVRIPSTYAALMQQIPPEKLSSDGDEAPEIEPHQNNIEEPEITTPINDSQPPSGKRQTPQP